MSAYTGSGAWTAVETAYLRDQLAVVPQTEIAEHLGRSKHAVFKKCKRLGITSPVERRGLNAGFLENKFNVSMLPKDIMQINQLRSAIVRVINRRLRDE
jgi:hypothetical protein